MTDTTSYIEMLKKFGSDIGLPKLDVDKLIDAHKKNIDALGQSVKVAAQGAQSVAQKQRELDVLARHRPVIGVQSRQGTYLLRHSG